MSYYVLDACFIAFTQFHLEKSWISINKSSHRRCSVKKGLLINFVKFPGKHPCRPANLLKNRLWHRCFPVSFAKFLRICFLQNISGRMLLYRNMEVMKAGYLKKNISTNTYKKQYKKFYFILKRDIENSSKKRLEYFKDENSCVKKEPKGVCNLYSQYNIHIKMKQERKFIFEIVDVDKSHELMTTNETTGKEWVELLTEGIVIQIFSVIKMHYPSSAQNYVKDMKGTVLLKIDESCVTLMSNSGPAIFWEFSVIRKCKMNNGLVILEVGKKSITGEGEFYFDTSDPKRLYDVLDRAVRERQTKRGIVPNSNTNETNKTRNVEPDGSTYECLPHVPDHIAKPSTPQPSSENTNDSLFSSTRIAIQKRSDPQIAPILNNTKLLIGKTKILSSVGNSYDTNKTNKTANLEPNDPTYDHLSHAPNQPANLSTPSPSSKNTYDSLLSSKRMITQQKPDTQIAPILNNTEFLSGKTTITSSVGNSYDNNNKANQTGNAELNNSTYDHLSHVSNYLGKSSTHPPSNKNTYDSLFSSTRIVTRQKPDPQIAFILNNTKLLSGKTKITSSVGNSCDNNKTNQTGNAELSNSTYDHLSHVSNYLKKSSTHPPSSKNIYDSLFFATRMVTQEKSDLKSAYNLNNTKLVNDKAKIRLLAVDSHDTKKTNKGGNLKPNLPEHLAKPSTQTPSNKNTYGLLFSSTRMITQQRSDSQIPPFLNNTKLLSCTSSAVTPLATPTISKSIYVEMDLCQINDINKPIPLWSRSRPATALRSMGLSLDSEMDLNDKLLVGKFINPTPRPREESTGDSNNMYEVLKEHSKLSNDNNQENRNSSPNECSHLFENPPKEVSNKLSECNHLKCSSPPKLLPRTNKLGLQISPVSPLKNKKKPLRPVRPPSLQQPVYEIPRTK